MEPLLTLDEVANILQLHVITIRKFVLAGKIRASQLGNKEYRVRQSDLEAFIEGSTVKRPAGPSEVK